MLFLLTLVIPRLEESSESEGRIELGSRESKTLEHLLSARYSVMPLCILQKLFLAINLSDIKLPPFLQMS